MLCLKAWQQEAVISMFGTETIPQSLIARLWKGKGVFAAWHLVPANNRALRKTLAEQLEDFRDIKGSPLTHVINFQDRRSAPSVSQHGFGKSASNE